ncbi:hypothetical protein Agub_g15766, partial [Astrephomene gubernaculifera]
GGGGGATAAPAAGAVAPAAGGSRRVGESLPLLPGGVPSGVPSHYAAMSASCGGVPSTAAAAVVPSSCSVPFRLAVYLVSSDPVPVGVLEAVSEEMKCLMPLVFGAMHAAIRAGGLATAEWNHLQTQLLQRSTISGALQMSGAMQHVTCLEGPPPGLGADRRPSANHPPPLALPGGGGGGCSPLPPHAKSPQGPPHHHPARSPRCGNGGGGAAGAAAAAASPSIIRRGSLGGGSTYGSTSRLRLASPAPPLAAGDPLLESNPLSLSAPSSPRGDEEEDGGGGGGGAGAGGGGGGGGGGRGGGGRSRRGVLREDAEDLLLSSSQMDELDVGPEGRPHGGPDYCPVRKVSAPCYTISSPVLRLEDVVGPRPLELLVSSARSRLTAVAAGSEVGEEARLAVSQDLAAVDLHEVIGSGGQGVVFRGTLHGLETAVKVWEHNARAPLEHDGEWLSAVALDAAWQENGGGGEEQHNNQQGPGATHGSPQQPPQQQQQPPPQQGQQPGGQEAVVSSRDCIRQAKRGAMEVAVTATLSHPNVVQTYAHFSDVVVVERQTAGGGAGGSGAPPQLRLCAHDDPVFRGQKAGPLNTVLCLEYCDAGTLLTAARRGDFRLPGSGPRDGPVWPDLVPLYTSLLEVALALRYLHSRRLVHCDLKPGNVLLRTSTRDPRGWTCKLSDFGCVRLLDEYGTDGSPAFRMAQVFGTVAYMAPECFSRGRLLGAGVDVFAFGVLMWELMHCRAPHAGVDPKDLPRLVVRNNARPEFHPLAPSDYCALACRCWSPVPERRPSATQLVSQLQQLLSGAKAAAAQQQQQRKLRMQQQQAQQQQQQAQQQQQQAQQQQQQAQQQQTQQQAAAAAQQQQQQQQQQATQQQQHPQQQHPQQQQQMQQQVQQLQAQRRALLRFPSAASHSEARLGDRLAAERAHQAFIQAQAQGLVGGPGSGSGKPAQLQRPSSPTLHVHPPGQQPQPQLSRLQQQSSPGVTSPHRGGGGALAGASPLGGVVGAAAVVSPVFPAAGSAGSAGSKNFLSSYEGGISPRPSLERASPCLAVDLRH